MKKLVTIFLAFAFVAISANQHLAQSRCTLTEANSPNVRGLRLGMTTQQLLALFPGASKRREMKDALEKAKAPAGGETVYLAFEPTTDTNKDEFAGVASVSAGLHKGKVVDLLVAYVGMTWGNIDDWVGKLSETFKLPGTQDWVAGPSENPNKVLKCSWIEIEASIQGGGASIRLRNMEALKEHEDRTSAGEEKKRRGFKP